MCSNCGFPSAPGHWTDAGAPPGTDRVRARHRRAAVLGRVLPAWGLTVTDDTFIPGLTVSTRTGMHRMVADLGEFWTAAEDLSGRRIDPLDPDFLRRGR